jgi:hypothetical protein
MKARSAAATLYSEARGDRVDKNIGATRHEEHMPDVHGRNKLGSDIRSFFHGVRSVGSPIVRMSPQLEGIGGRCQLAG